jgi:hypothetical protein
VDNYPGDIECFNQKFTTFNKFAVFSVNRTDDLLNNATTFTLVLHRSEELSGPKDCCFPTCRFPRFQRRLKFLRRVSKSQHRISCPEQDGSLVKCSRSRECLIDERFCRGRFRLQEREGGFT